MPLEGISAGLQNLGIGTNGQNSDGAEHTPFPATTKQAAGLVNGVQTAVSSIYFADKILLTVSQGGRLSQWVRDNSLIPCS